MPAWWKGKSNSKSKSTTSSPRKKELEAPTPSATPEEEDERARIRGREKKIKGKDPSSEDPITPRKSRDPSPICVRGGGVVGFMRGEEFAFGHPLPLPTSISSPLPAAVVLDHGLPSALASAPVSASASVSSSGSSDDAPDLPFYRYNDPVNKPTSRNGWAELSRHHHVTENRYLSPSSPASEHPRSFESSASPRREFQLHGFDFASKLGTTYPRGRTATETVSGRRAGSTSPRLRGHTLPTSPTHPGAFGLSPVSPNIRQENLKSPPHPLPLPLNSPTSSSSSRSPRSQWKKGKLLGRGTFGHVYIGFNSETGQMCAIKEVKNISDDVNSRESLRQLNQEITLLSQLSHPNIVQYYGSELVDDTLSVYLEYVSGGSIHKLLQEYGPFSEPVIRNYTAQILAGLAYLHGRNTVHRDIKGANILVGPNGEIKLADFGMAKHISKYTSIRSFKGSPYWMAPEVIMNINGYNLAVDIWSLGCTVLEMATSKPPWSQFEGVAAIFKIGNSKDLPEIPDHLSCDGKDFIRQCLRRDPSARPSAAELMAHPFVREQATTRSARFNMTRDALPSPDGNHHAMINMELSSSRYTSAHQVQDLDIGTRRVSGFPLASPSSSQRITSDIACMRMNMSLPVSPCSSPLRQFGQQNRSFVPSPPHPALSVDKVNCGPFNHSPYLSNRPINDFSDPLPEFSQLRVQTAHNSPRRLSMGF